MKTAIPQSPFDDFFATHVMTRDDASWARHGRVESFARFKALGLPTRALEAWHYSSLKGLGEMMYDAPSPVGYGDASAPSAVMQDLPEEVAALIPADAICLTFANGMFNPALSTSRSYPNGLNIARLGEFCRDENAHADNFFGDGNLEPAASLIHLNSAMASDGVKIEVAAGAEIASPLFIVQLTSGEPSGAARLFESTATRTRVPFTATRHSITLGENAGLTVCELHFGRDEAPFLANTFTRFRIGKAARMTYARVAKEPASARSIAVAWADLSRDALWETFDCGFGASLCRREIRARLLGEGADVRLNGLGAIKSGRHWDTHVSVEHLSPGATSRQVYKNIVSEGARSVYNGKVLVAKDAQHTNALQLNKNLLLGPGAEADTKPELEILADDVKVSHGATVGRPNPEEMFYFMSRGIPENEAMGILLRGFAGEITATAPAGMERGLNKLLEEEFFR